MSTVDKTVLHMNNHEKVGLTLKHSWIIKHDLRLYHMWSVITSICQALEPHE